MRSSIQSITKLNSLVIINHSSKDIFSNYGHRLPKIQSILLIRRHYLPYDHNSVASPKEIKKSSKRFKYELYSLVQAQLTNAI